MLARLNREKDLREKSQSSKKKPVNRRNASADGEDGPEDEPITLLRRPFDVRSDAHFRGETEVLLRFVPLKCIDERTLVEADALREWVLFAVIEEDAYVQAFNQRIAELEEHMAELDENLENVPKIDFRDEKNRPLPEEECRKRREALFAMISDERMQTDLELQEVVKERKLHIEWRRKMGVHLRKTETDMVTETCTWTLSLSGTTDALQIEDALLHKENWPGIKLAAGKRDEKTQFPPWAGRGAVPDGSNLASHDYRTLRVNMIATHIARVPKGVGMYTELDRQSSALASERFHVFYGEYENGLRSGRGFEISDLGVYVGGFEQDMRRGRGRLDLCDGTTILAPFRCEKVNTKLPDNPMFANPYLDGEPHGEAEIFFSDGAYFRGRMTDGVIGGGQGDYQSAMNEILSGHFEDGLLHGEKGYVKTAADEEFFGRFVQGELNGLGTYLNRYGDSYEGFWENNLRHGRGIAKYRNTGCYRGYFLNGRKHGKGSLEYEKKARETKKSSQNDETNVKEEKDKNAKTKPSQGPTKDDKQDDLSAEELEKEVTMTNHLTEFELSPFAQIFQGFFFANKVANQGCILNTSTHKHRIIARNHKRNMYPITKTLLREMRIEKEHHRNQERLRDNELFMRVEMAKKKAKIFRQQRHFTKKMLYEDSLRGQINYGDLDMKAVLREERLKNMTEDRYLFKKALIPRLQNMNTEPMHIYTDAFQRLEDVIDNAPIEKSPSDGKSQKSSKKKSVPSLDPYALSSKHSDGGLSTHRTNASETDSVANSIASSMKSGKSMRFSDHLSVDPSTASAKSSSSTNNVNSVNFINKKLFKVILGDLEEARERQRFLKYDLIWQRAEEAYIQTKRANAPS